jgi:hypothetical protein
MPRGMPGPAATTLEDTDAPDPPEALPVWLSAIDPPEALPVWLSCATRSIAAVLSDRAASFRASDKCFSIMKVMFGV